MNDLSIIVPSYNTEKITRRCIESIIKSLIHEQLIVEIIVVDNDSTDETVEEIQNLIRRLADKNQNANLKLKIIKNKENIGFAKANNQALKIAQGKYVLFLNSDVILNRITFIKMIELLEKNENIGGLTVKVVLPDGRLDPACHRGFPTLWRSFCYFSGLERFFGQLPIFNRIFGGYHLTHLDKRTVHEIDSPSGAFYLTRKSILKKLGGFDERFFMYGEDLDLSYQIKKLGYKIIFYPLEKVVHLKSQSGLKGKDRCHQKKIRQYFYQAMKLFYQKNYASLHPKQINSCVYFLIDLLKK